MTRTKSCPNGYYDAQGSLPAVSVVIPTVGRLELERAVKSALQQDYSGPLEVVVADDSTVGIVRPSDWSASVKIVRAGPRGGGNQARNVGVRASQGDLIAFLDDDDYWSKTHLREAVESLLGVTGVARGENALFSGSGRLRDGRSFPQRAPEPSEGILDFEFRLRGGLKAKGGITTSSIVVWRSNALKVPWRENLRFHQDLHWVIDYCREFPDCPFVFSNDATVFFGDTPGSVSKSMSACESVDWANKAFFDCGIVSRPQSRRYFDFLVSRAPMRRAVEERNPRAAFQVWRSALTLGVPTVWGFAFGTIQTLRCIWLGVLGSMTRNVASDR